MSLRPGRGSQQQQQQQQHQATPGSGGYYPAPPIRSTSGGYGGIASTPITAATAASYYGSTPPPPPRPPLRASPPAPAATHVYGSNGYASPPASGGGHVPYAGYGSSSAGSATHGGYANGSAGGSGASAGGYGTNGGTAYSGSYTSTIYAAAPTPTPPQQQQGDIKDLKKVKRRSGTGINTRSSGGGACSFLKTLTFWSTVTALSMSGVAVYYRMQLKAIFNRIPEADSVEALVTQLDQIIAKEQQTSSTMRSVRDSLRIANEHKMALERDNRKYSQMITEKEKLAHEQEMERNSMLAREDAWKSMLMNLKEKIQRDSYRDVKEKYGLGPHQVEFAVHLPNTPEGSLLYFVVQMAELSLMPHAIHLFLEQVSHGLWDNSWIYINGPHVIQAGPQGEDTTADEDHRHVSLKPFRELALDAMAFPEYSDKFPHAPWTLGYTGRPGGPDFYINKQDNSDGHGPGGQTHYDLGEFADACFAKVVRGFDALEEIAKVPTVLEGEYKYFFEYPVQIVKVVVLPRPIDIDQALVAKYVEGFAHVELRSSNESEAQRKKIHFAKPEIENQVVP